jgi:Fe-S-cluster containining protein
MLGVSPSAPDAREAELALLCRSCGLCCDGSLFGRVDLEAMEVEPAKRRGLRILTNGNGFEQPCAAHAQTGCAIYEERPLSCRRFTCRLYERHRREGGPIEKRLAAVRRVRALLAGLAPSGAVPPELTSRLEEDFARSR